MNFDESTDADRERHTLPRGPAPRGAWARSAWLATTALLALALVANAAASYRGSRTALPGLDRGQADYFGAGALELLTDTSKTSDAAQLTSFLRANERRGLRYVALVDDEGRTIAGAGRAAIVSTMPDRNPTTGRVPLIRGSERLRAYFPAPVRVAASEEPARLIVEFEPTASMRLMDVARRSLALSLATAILLFVLALVFFRISSHYESARLRLERDRHLARLGEMSAVLAHEIRNPLASLKGHAQLAAERLAEGSRERRCVENVIGDAERLGALTSDLLTFARSSPLELDLVNPGDLLRRAASDVLGEEALTIDDAAAPAKWLLDAERMRQALVNLLDNAWTATSGSRAPAVRIANEADQLVFEIRDFGPGLPRGSEHRIFDPFFTTRTNGTGLGLAVASRVVETHGGRIEASNHPEGGALFRLMIPTPDR